MEWVTQVKFRVKGHKYSQTREAYFRLVKVGEQYYPVTPLSPLNSHILTHNAAELYLKPLKRSGNKKRKFYLRRLRDRWWLVVEENGRIEEKREVEAVTFLTEPYLAKK